MSDNYHNVNHSHEDMQGGFGSHADCNNCFSSILGDFTQSFDKSAKRWELIVYPSLFAFIILAMYGFFLIYSLTQDIRTMAVSIDPKMGRNMGSLSLSIKDLSDNVELMSTHLEYISDNMETMSVDMQTMSESITHMTENVGTMDSNISTMTGVMQSVSVNMDSINGTMTEMNTELSSMGPITTNLTSMNQAIQHMTASMGRMGYDVNHAARPMSFINRFMPW
ncbi:MAG: hypothetical protein HQL52_13005 [Magnetococcales bacterium]|nr:hypothetical protein [Magnetococcales bacterium]